MKRLHALREVLLKTPLLRVDFVPKRKFSSLLKLASILNATQGNILRHAKKPTLLFGQVAEAAKTVSTEDSNALVSRMFSNGPSWDSTRPQLKIWGRCFEKSDRNALSRYV